MNVGLACTKHIAIRRLPSCQSPRARRVGGRLSRLAAARALRPCGGGCRVAEADPHRSRWVGRSLRRAARARYVGRAGRTARTQAHRAADARGRPRRRQPPAQRRRDHPACPGGSARARSGGSQFLGRGPQPALGGDITFVPTAAGFLYLAVVVDAWSPRVVGWSMATHLRTELVLDALEMAVMQRRPRDVIPHSDSQKIGASSRAV
ncbi:hypothetical protein E8E01_17860 [Methylorubrum populi]|nr:hypothetical protein E8E01_17860 [Methylorubrum populi]